MTKSGEEQSVLGFMSQVRHKEPEEKEVDKVAETIIGIYDTKEVVSTLVKSIRLGKVEDAIYWYEVLVQGEVDLVYVARRLMIEAQESGYGLKPAVYAASVFKIISIGRNHAQDALIQLIVFLCRCPKWWEHKHMRDAYQHWYLCEKQVAAIKKGERKPKPIPEYALDLHTTRGWQIKKSGGKVDERFSGSEKGIFAIMALFEKYGRLSDEDHLDSQEEYALRKMLYTPEMWEEEE